jgi:hypothetical protein
MRRDHVQCTPMQVAASQIDCVVAVRYVINSIPQRSRHVNASGMS